MHETHIRSVAKGITWRVLASATTMMVVYIVTGDVVLMASVGLFDITLKIFFYYLHERTWGRVRWGILGPEPCVVEPAPKTGDVLQKGSKVG
jgi:adenylylsulfate kinase